MKPIRRLTIVMAYYENPTMLAAQITSLDEMPPEIQGMLRLIVVDDCSPLFPARIAGAHAFGRDVYRLKVDVPWNQDACRNLGARMAATDWMLLTDMDHVPSRELLTYLLCERLDEGNFYRFGRVTAPKMDAYKPHPNSYAMTKALYWKAGGYDERRAGVYGTDGNFRRALDRISSEVFVRAPLIRFPREVIPDASTTQFERQSKSNEELKRKIDADIKASGQLGPLVHRFGWSKVQ